MKSTYNFFLIILLTIAGSLSVIKVHAYNTHSMNSALDAAGNSILLVSPPDNSITSYKNINFIWNSDPGAISYKLLISKVPNFANIFFADSTLTDTFTTVSVLDPDETYFWKVSGKNDSAYFISSDTWNFGIEGLLVTLINPSFGENFVSIPVTFEWTSVNTSVDLTGDAAPYQRNNNVLNSTTQYMLEIATDKQFSNIIYLDSKIIDTFQTVSTLDFNSVFYWRITPQNDSFFFAAAESYFNTFQNELLLNSPSDSETVPIPVEFSWFTEADAVSYRLEVAADPLFTVIVYSDSTLTDTTQSVDALSMGYTYYWKVSAKNNSGYFASSVVRTLFTATITPIVLSSPPNNAASVTMPIIFSWFPESEAVSYKLEVATDPNFTIGSIAFRDTSITDTVKIVPALDFGTLYYWKVYAKNNLVYYTESPVWNFTTVSLPTYSLLVRNMSLQSINVLDDALEFDICIQHTNSRAAFEYAGGQYFLSFNGGIIGNSIPDTNEATYRIISSDLPAGLQPENPSIIVAGNPTALVLSLSANTFPGSGNGYIVSNSFPGTKIARMRILKKTGTFNTAYLNLAWRNPPVVTSATKIFSYVDSVLTDITTPGTHSIDSSGIGILPVELSSFVSNVSGNNVNLNWTTEREISNYGFDIERSNVKSQTSNDWIKVGFVKGSGTTNESKSYSFTETVNSGKYNYRLKQIDFNGNYEYYSLANDVEVGIPSDYSLSQNYPNPFNPATVISYQLPVNGEVSLKIFDLAGREVMSLINEQKEAGYYSIQFNGTDLSSGMYFYRMSVNGIVLTKKMALVK